MVAAIVACRHGAGTAWVGACWNGGDWSPPDAIGATFTNLVGLPASGARTDASEMLRLVDATGLPSKRTTWWLTGADIHLIGEGVAALPTEISLRRK